MAGEIIMTIHHEQVKVNKTKVKRISEDGRRVRFVIVKAHPDNPSLVYIGGAGVNADNGFPLAAGDHLTIEHEFLDRIFVIADATGCRVAWYAPG